MFTFDEAKLLAQGSLLLKWSCAIATSDAKPSSDKWADCLRADLCQRFQTPFRTFIFL